MGSEEWEVRIVHIENAIHQVTRCALMAGMGWGLVMMLLTTCDVLGRYFFSMPVPGSKELSEFMLAGFGMLGMAYAQHSGGNVRVTFLTQALPPLWRAVTDALTSLLSLVIVALITWQAGIMGTEDFHAGATSDLLGIPIYPFRFLLSAGAFFLCLEILTNLASSVRKVFGKR